MQLTRKTVVLVAVLLIALVTAGAFYIRRVNRAVAECDMPAPPDKPATPAPNLPGFAAGDACGPGEAVKGADKAPHGDVAAAAGTKR